jgi:uncharacterized membrane protein YkgB
MNALIALTQKVSAPLLRISLGIVLFWIGAIKFADPAPVVGLLAASFSFLAFPAFAYFLGVFEVVVAVMLFAGFKLEYAGLLSMGLFAGTLLIFLIAPQITYGEAGFPLLAFPGEFLLKDLVLFAASASIVANSSASPRAQASRAFVGVRAAS